MAPAALRWSRRSSQHGQIGLPPSHRGCSLRHIGLQPPPHTVAASAPDGHGARVACSKYRTPLAPPLAAPQLLTRTLTSRRLLTLTLTLTLTRTRTRTRTLTGGRRTTGRTTRRCPSSRGSSARPTTGYTAWTSRARWRQAVTVGSSSSRGFGARATARSGANKTAHRTLLSPGKRAEGWGDSAERSSARITTLLAQCRVSVSQAEGHT